jgi:hypothetical protein
MNIAFNLRLYDKTLKIDKVKKVTIANYLNYICYKIRSKFGFGIETKGNFSRCIRDRSISIISIGKFWSQFALIDNYIRDII